LTVWFVLVDILEEDRFDKLAALRVPRIVERNFVDEKSETPSPNWASTYVGVELEMVEKRNRRETRGFSEGARSV
jgi:hypothetical protein